MSYIMPDAKCWLVLVLVFCTSFSLAGVCGDGTANLPLEQCDGADLNGKSCTDFCYSSGTLSCTSYCHFNVSQCVANTCGDGFATRGEQCDTTDLKSQTCQSLGYDEGTLSCSGSCHFNTSQCHYCGDGVITGLESCDGSAMNGFTCINFGFDYGVLSCNSTCGYDTSGCRHYYCGDGMITGEESCDGSLLGGMTCNMMGFDYGTLFCTSSCGFSTANCHMYYCGDGMVTGSEQCDGTVGTATCVSLGFDSGTLSCSSTCSYDTASCQKCGNGVVEGTEQCDGTALAGQSCSSSGYASGPLGCTSTCGFNYTQCLVPDLDCVTNQTTLVGVMTCYESHAIPNNGMNPLLFPTDAQRIATASLVDAMLTNDGNCASLVVPSAIVADIQLRTFLDTSNGIQYCIIMDHKDQNHDGIWDNGFTMFVTPDRRYDIQRRVHMQATHPIYDAGTLVQNTNNFQQMGAHSLLTHGMHPYAYGVAPSTCHTGQFATDANEEIQLMFQWLHRQIFNTSNGQGWNPLYIQMHGMAPGNCADDIYLTYGAINPAFYTGTTNLIVNLQNYLKNTTSYATDTPATKTCSAVNGIRSIQGRILNYIPIGSECTGLASTVSYKYIHIEQKATPRTDTIWYSAFRTYIPTDCASGRTYNPSTMMCS